MWHRAALLATYLSITSTVVISNSQIWAVLPCLSSSMDRIWFSPTLWMGRCWRRLLKVARTFLQEWQLPSSRWATLTPSLPTCITRLLRSPHLTICATASTAMLSSICQVLEDKCLLDQCTRRITSSFCNLSKLTLGQVTTSKLECNSSINKIKVDPFSLNSVMSTFPKWEAQYLTLRLTAVRLRLHMALDFNMASQ